MIRDRLASFNERIKLLASFLNATSLGLVGFGVLRPMINGDIILVEDSQRLGPQFDMSLDKFNALSTLNGEDKLGLFLNSEAPSLISMFPAWGYWLIIGLALHVAAHYILGHVRKEAP